MGAGRLRRNGLETAVEQQLAQVEMHSLQSDPKMAPAVAQNASKLVLNYCHLEISSIHLPLQHSSLTFTNRLLVHLLGFMISIRLLQSVYFFYMIPSPVLQLMHTAPFSVFYSKRKSFARAFAFC